ncbi:MAG: hypothetical protein IT177_18060 [Acidobacteria bacterium]|nr:hypothetical protein [Acidobacteriota bacterium]
MSEAFETRANLGVSTAPSVIAHGTAPAATRRPARPYGQAHWYLTAALTSIVAGFWPSFFQPLGAGDVAHSLHGITATGWVVALIVQSWLASRGHRAWHRRVAIGALLLLPVFVASALQMVHAMFLNPNMPPGLARQLAFIDLPSVAFLLVLVALALWNVRRPAAHRRFMAATVLLGLPPALGRLYARVLAPQVDFMGALHGSLYTVEAILVVLIVSDWRAGQRRLAYPLSLAFFVALHAGMAPVAASEAWGRAMAWFNALPVFG